MIHRFPNPFVKHVWTEIDTEARKVWHIYTDNRRVRAEHSMEWWLPFVPCDPDLQVDEGL